MGVKGFSNHFFTGRFRKPQKSVGQKTATDFGSERALRSEAPFETFNRRILCMRHLPFRFS
jgi:hypothetical protein